MTQTSKRALWRGEAVSLALGIIKSQIARDVINESTLRRYVHIYTSSLHAYCRHRFSGAKGNSLALRAHPSAICLLTFAKYFVSTFIRTIGFNSFYIKRIPRSHAREYRIHFEPGRRGTSIVALCCLVVFRGEGGG